jgi:hypothetical protein
MAVIPTHRTPLIWHPVTSSYFQKWNWSWKDASVLPLRRSRPNRRECVTLTKKTSRMHSKNGGDGGTGVYVREETIRRWWLSIGLMVSFVVFTASARNVLDSTSYFMSIATVITRNGNQMNKGSVPCRHNLPLHHHNPPGFHPINATGSLYRNKNGNLLRNIQALSLNHRCREKTISIIS